jgi:hypothetical protein
LLSKGSETPQTSKDWPILNYLFSRLFLTNDLLLDQEILQLISHVTQLAKFQQALLEIKQATPREDIKGPPLFCPGDLVLIKSPNLTKDLNTPP